jgi:hypothetical protein
VGRGEADASDATIEGDPGTLAAVLWHRRPLAEAERAGAITVTGSRTAAKRFLRAFPLAGAGSPATAARSSLP